MSAESKVAAPVGGHTPGPWDTDTGGDVTRADGTTLLTREKPMDCTLDESFANAILAAAAPELLEAVMAMIEWDDREQDHTVGFTARMALCAAAFEKARAAIARATGAAS